MSIIDRPSNIILDSLNRIHYGKLTGGLSKKELSEEIIRIGDLVANSIRNGKIGFEVLEEIKGHVPSSINYFRFPHEGIGVAKKTFVESLGIAESERAIRVKVK